MALPTQTITVIKNGKLLGPLDCNGQLLSNADPGSFPGGPGGGNDTGTTTAILKGDGNHGFADAVADADYSTPAGLSSAIATREPLLPTPSGDNYLLTRHDAAHGSTWLYTNPNSIQGSNPGASTAILKGNGTGGFNDAVAGTDYATPSALTSGLATKENTLPTTVPDGYVLARHNAGAGSAWYFVDPVTLGSTSATYADGATHSNTTFNSTLAVFSSNDTGKTIVCAGNIPSSTTITFVNATTVTLSNAATTTASGLTFTILNRYVAAGGGGTVTNVAATSDPTTGAGDLLSVTVNNPTTSAQIVLTKPVTTGAKTFYGNGATFSGPAGFMSQAVAYQALDITTVGKNIAQLPNPGVISYIRMLADNTVQARTPAQTLGDLGAESALTFNTPLTRSGSPAIQIGIQTASTSQTGAISATDWNTFNSKVAPGRSLSVTGPLLLSGGAQTTPATNLTLDLTANRVFGINRASSTLDGYLASTDFAAFSAAAPRAATGLTSGTMTINTTSPPIGKIVFFSQLATPGLTVILPSAAGYSVLNGAPILEFVDMTVGGLMANFGMTLQALSGQTIDGAASITIPRGAGYIRLNPDGSNSWYSTKYFVDSFKDPGDPTKKAVISVANFATATSRTLRPAPGADSVTVVPATGDVTAGNYVYDVDANGNLLRTAIPTQGVNVGAFLTLTDAPTITWTADQGLTKQKAKVTLGGNRTLAITNARNGEEFELLVIQDGTGSRSLTIPLNSYTPNNGLGTITLTSAAGAKDKLKFTFDNVLGYLFETPSLNLTTTAITACNVPADVGATAGGAVQDTLLGNLTNNTRKYISFGMFTASSGYVMCRVDVFLIRFGTGGGGDITFTVYADNAGAPGAVVGTPDLGIISAASISTSSSLYSITGLNASLTGGSVYHIVAKSTQTVFNNVDYVGISSRSVQTGVTQHRSADGSTWAATTAPPGPNGRFTTYHS